MASIASDADHGYGEMHIMDDDGIFSPEDRGLVVKVSNVEWKNGVDPTEGRSTYSAAAAARRWTAECFGTSSLTCRGGDLVRLLLAATGEAFASAVESSRIKSRGCDRASAAADAILREPVR